MSVMTEKKLDHLHWPLVLCTVVICALGVWNLASATKNAVNPMWLAQSKWMLLGIVAVGAFLFIDYRFLATAEIGRASCRERVESWVVGRAITKEKNVQNARE